MRRARRRRGRAVSYALLFPGQGSQAVGMGADVFAARPDLAAAAAEVLGWDLARLCREGPEEALTRTEHAQPALYTVAFALWEALAARPIPPPAAAAGHSLGEYTALAAAGVIAFEDGLRLVAARGRAMAAAAAAAPSGMAALLGAEAEAAEALAAARRAEGGSLWVANVNAPGQVVLAGGVADLAWAEEHAREHGVRRVAPAQGRRGVPLAVHGPGRRRSRGGGGRRRVRPPRPSRCGPTPPPPPTRATPGRCCCGSSPPRFASPSRWPPWPLPASAPSCTSARET